MFFWYRALHVSIGLSTHMSRAGLTVVFLTFGVLGQGGGVLESPNFQELS